MWARAVLLCAALLSVLCPSGSTEAERDEREVQDYRYNSNRLLGALHEVLEKLQTKRINPWEKKYGQVPSGSPLFSSRDERKVGELEEIQYSGVLLLDQEMDMDRWIRPLLGKCDLGEHCAIRKGSRIGKMCDCPRGAFCNFFLLKCL